MYKESKIKRFLLKKPVWIVLVTLIISLITIPNLKTSASQNKTEVLEIQPGNIFELESDDTMNVTKIDMPTFISMVDELAGKYDVIYIGDKNSNLNKKWSTSFAYRSYSSMYDKDLQINGKNMIYNDRNGSDKGNELNEKYLAKYTDDNTEDRKWNFLRYAQSLWYGTLGYTPDDFVDVAWTTWGKIKVDSSLFKNRTINNFNNSFVDLKDYYSENDITNRRAKEIKKLIDSGQLVYLNENLVKKSSYGETKLYNNFHNYYVNRGDYSNLKFITSLSNKRLKDDYDNISGQNKRPLVDLKSVSGGDCTISEYRDNIGKVGNVDNRKMSFQFSVNKPANTSGDVQYYANLYFDYSGDTLFDEESEIAVQGYALKCGDDVNNLEFILDYDFVGYLDWKLEIYSKDNCNVKTCEYGNTVFKALGNNSKEIKVLQVVPNDCNLVLNRNGSNAEKTFKRYLDELRVDYNICIDSKTVSEFNNMKSSDVKKKYDMIIIGFGDSYGNVNQGNVFNSNAIKIIEDFNNANKSLMFTHDTISLALLGKLKLDDVDSNINLNEGRKAISEHEYNAGDSAKFSQTFKDIVGQSRYIDPYASVSSNDRESYNSYHDRWNNENVVSIGSTPFASIKLYELSFTKKVKNINNGQISSYPFVLNEDNKNVSNLNRQIRYTLNVANTHIQWYQLNLEDESLVPFYNIVPDSTINNNYGNLVDFNEGDSRNFYYTYSVGNITYSGTGHSGDYTNEELKLFVNTIIKAYRSVVTPPKVTYVLDGENKGDNVNVSTTVDNNFEFSTNILHRYSVAGKDNLKVSILADGKPLIDVEGRVMNNQSIVYESNGINVDLILNKDYLVSKMGQTINITAYAEDKFGQDSEVANLNVYVEVKQIEASIYHGKNINETNNWQYTSTSIYDYLKQSTREKPSTIVPMVGYIHMYPSEDDRILLNIAPQLSEENDCCAYSDETHANPTVFAVDSSGSLKELGIMEFDYESNGYFYNLDRATCQQYINNGYTNIVVLYYVITGDNTSMQNSNALYSSDITLEKQDKTATAIVNPYKLPTEDLF